MYLTLPLAIAAVSILIIGVMVLRKLPFLRKLEPESHEVGDTVLHDFAPELLDWFRRIPWRQYWRDTLVEFEKFLRKARLLMSTLDRASDKVIRRVRKVHTETARVHEEVVAQREADKREAEEEPDEIDINDPEQLKQEEQRLIVAIAQSPKEAQLYSDLAKVYMRFQNYADAVESLETACKLMPENEKWAKRLETARRRKERVEAEKDSEQTKTDA